MSRVATQAEIDETRRFCMFQARIGAAYLDALDEYFTDLEAGPRVPVFSREEALAIRQALAPVIEGHRVEEAA